MERKAALRVAGLALSLALAGIAASAQDGPPPAQDGFAPPADFQGPGGPPGQNPFGGPPPGQFRGPGFGGPMNGPLAPEMAKKTAEIMALRQIKGMRLTAQDIRAALPALKTMRDSARDLQRLSEAALDAEKKALLAAGPDSPEPPGAGEKMQEVMERHRQITEQSWQRLTQAIGPEKAGGIRGLLGQGGPGMRGPFGGGFGRGGGQGFGPGGGGPFGGQGGPGPDGFQPGQGGGGFGRGGGRGQGGGVGGPPPGQPGQQGPGGGGDFGGPPPGEPGQQPFPSQGGPGGGQRRQQGQAGQGPGFGGGGGFGRGGGFGGPGGPPMGGMGPAISISDLVDLLEQKLAVMKP